MRLPVTQLDDRNFDDLVAEARQRLTRHLPDLQPTVEGDPVHALVDLFAFMTESVIYRANLIPERQRQAFLNLLQLPLRPAKPASGLVSIDAKPKQNNLTVAPLLRAEVVLREGAQTFTTQGEITPLPLELKVLTKEKIADDTLRDAGITAQQLLDQYGRKVDAFRPRNFAVGEDSPDLTASLDGYLYLLLHLPDVKFAAQAPGLRQALAGQTINIGLAPFTNIPGEVAEEVLPRDLLWEVAYQKEATGQPDYLPLEVLDDTSQGGRKSGVVRLRLPNSADVLDSNFANDPRQAGYGARPPEPPAGVTPDQVMVWLRLSAPEENLLDIAYIDVNSVAVRGQGVERNVTLGAGTGRPGQVVTLPNQDVEASSLRLQVAEQGNFRIWTRVGHFAGSGPEDRVYRLDASTGLIDFGDGLRGKRPEPRASIRAAYYRYGGGLEGNLAPGTLKRLDANTTDYTVRQPWSLVGGVAGETIPQAEARIPAFLTHRARAVTKDDFSKLARDNPVTPIERAEAVPGLMPGANLSALRSNVPGAVSVFVLPSAPRAFAAAPRPTAGVLRDVFQYLDQRKMVGNELYVLAPQYVQLALAVAMTPVDPKTRVTTSHALQSALLTYLWSLAPGGPAGTGWPMGRDIDVNELRTAASRTPGVQSIDTMTAYHHDRETDVWVELNEQKLRLQPYQLPEIMEVKVAETLSPPTIVSNGQGTELSPLPQPAPVAPDIC